MKRRGKKRIRPCLPRRNRGCGGPRLWAARTNVRLEQPQRRVVAVVIVFQEVGEAGVMRGADSSSGGGGGGGGGGEGGEGRGDGGEGVGVSVGVGGG